MTLNLSTYAKPGGIFDWTPLPDLPEPSGIKGFYGLKTSDGFAILGGSTFKLAQRQGGRKSYLRSIYHLKVSASASAEWIATSQELPFALAEGASVLIGEASYLIGGQSEDGPSDVALKATWDEGLERVEFERLPPLPEPSFHSAATFWNGSLYVAGGNDGSGGLHRFWTIDLSRDPLRWEELPPWPGPARFGSVLEVLTCGSEESLYLFSGKSKTTTPRSQDNYLVDAYRFDFVSRSWQTLSPMPRAALIGIAAKVAPGALAILSGSDGHDIDRLSEIGEDYRLPSDILYYSAEEDRWSEAGAMPLGVIGVPLLRDEFGFILAGGEYSPGARTAKAFRISTKPNASR